MTAELTWRRASARDRQQHARVRAGNTRTTAVLANSPPCTPHSYFAGGSNCSMCCRFTITPWDSIQPGADTRQLFPTYNHLSGKPSQQALLFWKILFTSLFHGLSSGGFFTSQADLTPHRMSPEHKVQALHVEECLARNRKDSTYQKKKKRKIMSSHDRDKQKCKTSHARSLADKKPTCVTYSFGLGYAYPSLNV